MDRIRKGDHVVVTTGKDKGKKGIVLSVTSDSTVIVKGVGVVLRAVRPNPNKNVRGGLVKKERPIHVSNVALWDEEAGCASRIGIRVNAAGQRERFFKKTGHAVVLV